MEFPGYPGVDPRAEVGNGIEKEASTEHSDRSAIFAPGDQRSVIPAPPVSGEQHAAHADFPRSIRHPQLIQHSVARHFERIFPRFAQMAAMQAETCQSANGIQ